MFDNWNRTGKIIKDTFKMAKKDKSLYFPPILELVSFIIFGIAALIVFFIGSFQGDGTISYGYLAAALGILFLGYLFSALFSAALAWMVFEAYHGKKPTLGAGMKRAFKKFGSLMTFAIVNFVVSMIVAKLRDNENDSFWKAILKNIFASLIEKGWDIAGSFMLPAIALTDKNFVGAAKEIPMLFKHLPETLVGGFAFDAVVGWIYLLDAIIALAFGFAFYMISPVVGIVIGVSIFLLLAMVTHVLYDFCKSTYFTLMYIELHPELKKKEALKQK